MKEERDKVKGGDGGPKVVGGGGGAGAGGTVGGGGNDGKKRKRKNNEPIVVWCERDLCVCNCIFACLRTGSIEKEREDI